MIPVAGQVVRREVGRGEKGAEGDVSMLFRNFVQLQFCWISSMNPKSVRDTGTSTGIYTSSIE